MTIRKHETDTAIVAAKQDSMEMKSEQPNSAE